MDDHLAKKSSVGLAPEVNPIKEIYSLKKSNLVLNSLTVYLDQTNIVEVTHCE
jgi:hypothetical protein